MLNQIWCSPRFEPSRHPASLTTSAPRINANDAYIARGQEYISHPCLFHRQIHRWRYLIRISFGAYPEYPLSNVSFVGWRIEIQRVLG
jgi:hypothetical protein